MSKLILSGGVSKFIWQPNCIQFNCIFIQIYSSQIFVQKMGLMQMWPMVCAALLLCLVALETAGYLSDFPGPYCGTRPGGCCQNRTDSCAVPISSKNWFSRPRQRWILKSECNSLKFQLLCATAMNSVSVERPAIAVQITNRIVWEKAYLLQAP